MRPYFASAVSAGSAPTCSPFLTAFTNRFAMAVVCLITILAACCFLFTPAAVAQSDLAVVAPWQLPPELQPSPRVYPAGAIIAGDSPPEAKQQSAEQLVAEPNMQGGELNPGNMPEEAVQSDCGVGDCGDVACGLTCDECGDWACPTCWSPFASRLRFRGEYLMWWGKAVELPTLVTTSPEGTSINEAGVIGAPGTSVLVGGSVTEPLRSGARFTLGWWWTPCQDEGIEATYFFLGSQSTGYDLTSVDHPILARPFYNAQRFTQDAVVLTYPDRREGWVNVSTDSELESVAALYRYVLWRECESQVDFLLGYRYGRFYENLSIASSTTFTNPIEQVPVGTVMEVFDVFDARNEFHGGEFGIVAKGQYCRWSLEVLAKLALGGTRSRLIVNGGTTVTVPGQSTVSYTGGMSALESNIGDYKQEGFSVIPELGVTVGYDLTCRLKATFGYTFLYWSRVVRPAEQIDDSLNPSQFPPGSLSGYPAPQPLFVLSDYWAQGLNFGFEYRF